MSIALGELLSRNSASTTASDVRFASCWSGTARHRGRPHWATVLGFLLVVGLTLALVFADFGHALVAAQLIASQ